MCIVPAISEQFGNEWLFKSAKFFLIIFMPFFQLLDCIRCSHICKLRLNLLPSRHFACSSKASHSEFSHAQKTMSIMKQEATAKNFHYAYLSQFLFGASKNVQYEVAFSSCYTTETPDCQC